MLRSLFLRHSTIGNIVASLHQVRFSSSQVVTLDYHDLVAGKDLGDKIENAYGFNGFGILTVSNIPNVAELRQNLLPLSLRFAKLPDEIKSQYQHPQSFYSFGWSHGIEKLEGKPDFSKGSYYANPQYDVPINDEELIRKYPAFIHPNIWPTAHVPEFETAFKEMGQLVVHVGTMVAAQCDKFIKQQCPSYESGKLERIISSSKCCKARLLHYFPIERAQSETSFSDWCGWHNDHGSLTGLVPAIFMNDQSGAIIPNPDPNAGLYIRTRKGDTLKVTIPSSHLGFQIGEAAQIHSGGFLQATPHSVRGPNVAGVSRETYAVFMEPMWDELMQVPSGVTPEYAQTQEGAKELPKGVPALKTRWVNGMNFGEFTEKTLNAYY